MTTQTLRPSRPAINNRWLTVTLAVAFGVLIVAFARWGPDWPAQEFRAWVARHEGLAAWTDRWYGGEALPGYSVLYPLFAAVLGAGVTGLVSVAVAAWAASALAPAGRARGRWFAAAVAVALAQNLLIGQVPFLLGAAFGMLAFRGVITSRPWWLVAVFSAACSLASPLAALSLLLTGPAVVMTSGWRRAIGLGGAVAGMGVSFFVGGAEGPFPLPWLTLMGVLAFCAVVVVMSRDRPEHRALTVFALTYGLAALAFFLFPNPIGGNIARLGKIIAVPLAVRMFAVAPGVRRRLVALASVVAAFVWPTVAFESSIAHGAADPSQQRVFYSGLIKFLHTQNPSRGRLEIPFTREHWEALWVAQAFPLARGWERQTDLLYNNVLYSPLSAQRYHRWLDRNAVHLVALPDVPIDEGGKAESQLLQNPPSYLRPVWHDQHWRVWRVVGARPMVTGAALTSSASSSLTLSFARRGVAVVRIHASRLWVISSGVGCVDATPGGWIRVRTTKPGTVTLSAELNSNLLTGSTSCSTEVG